MSEQNEIWKLLPEEYKLSNYMASDAGHFKNIKKNYIYRTEEYARKKGTSYQDMKDVYDFVVDQYTKELEETPFSIHNEDNDGSNDPETVMYDFFRAYPTHYIFPEETQVNDKEVSDWAKT